MNKRLISVLLWFFGLVFIIRGITLIGESILGGVLMMSAGVLILPVTQKAVTSNGSSFSPKWLSVCAFILLILSGASINASEERALKNGTASQELIDRETKRQEHNQQQEEAKAKREANENAQKQQREIEKQQRSNLIATETDSRNALKSHLKDPNSAEIRNHKGNCGEVNSKNSFGGYTGFRRFIASSAIVAIEGENMESSEFQKAWEKICQ